MNDRQLKYILTIAKEGNITAAAQKLYISQPSLSYLLAYVEKELGVKLFDRNVSPLALTYAGEYYVEAAKKILGIQQELQSQIDDIQDYRKGRLIIGCSSRLSSLLFPAILPNFIKEHPRIKIKLFEEKVPVLEELLASGTLELAFTTANINNNILGRVPVYDEELILLTPSSFTPTSVSERGKHSLPMIDLSQVGDHPFVLFKPRHQLRKEADKVFTDTGIRPNVILETDNWETCYCMAEEGIAFTVLPYSPLKKKNFSDKVNLYRFGGNNSSRQLSIYYRKNTYHLKIINTFISFTQSVLNDYPIENNV